MPAVIIDGEAIAREIRAEAQVHVERLRDFRVQPGLAVVVVGDDPASLSYIGAKTRACANAGILCETLRLPAAITSPALLSLVRDLNQDRRFHGLLVQQPLPAQIDPALVVAAVAPEKDVDGLHPWNLGLLMQGTPQFMPCTPAGVCELLVRSGHDPAGKRVVIVGRSNLVGKPLAALLMQKRAGGNATVTVCHSGTPRLASITAQAEIVVVAVGQASFLTAEMVCGRATVVDVGINRIEDLSRKSGYRVVGDVDFDNVAAKVAAITPVPGGVGPMTVAMLVANTVKAAEAARDRTVATPAPAR